MGAQFSNTFDDIFKNLSLVVSYTPCYIVNALLTIIIAQGRGGGGGIIENALLDYGGGGGVSRYDHIS